MGAKTKIASVSFPPLMKEEIDILVESGHYASKSDVIRDAFRVFLENKPDKRTTIAVELYKKGKVSLTRGAEIAGMGFESFKELLEDRGIKLKTYEGTKRELEEGVKLI